MVSAVTWRERLPWRRAGNAPSLALVQEAPPPAVTWREQLERAIALARPRCRRCGDDHVTVEWRDQLGWIPVQHHWVYSDQLYDGCPALNGGYPAWSAHEDLWAALDAHLPRDDYGIGPYAETSFARRELAEAAA